MARFRQKQQFNDGQGFAPLPQVINPVPFKGSIIPPRNIGINPQIPDSGRILGGVQSPLPVQPRITGGFRPPQNGGFNPQTPDGGRLSDRVLSPQNVGIASQQQSGGSQNFGLQGAEQALQGGVVAGSNALQTGQQSALNTLLLGNDLAQQNIGRGIASLQGGAQAGTNQIQQGFLGALDQLNQGQQALGGDFSASAVKVDPLTGQPLFKQAASGVGAFSPAGLQAQGLQSALSGAQGQAAFDQAFIKSPVQQFLREQGEQSRINQAAATGGLGGGEVQKELLRFGQGLAGQQLQQQISNLQNLSGQGLQAAGQQGQFLSQAGQQQGQLAGQNAQLGTQANLANARNRLNAAQNQAQLFGQGAGFSQQAGLSNANLIADAANKGASLFGQGANINTQLAGQGAGIQQNTGQNLANLFTGAGQNLAQTRTQAGRDLATQIGQSTSALSGLQNQQGQGLSDILGQGGINIANLVQNAGQLDAAQQTQLAQLLANISTGQGTQLSNIAIGQGNAASNAALQQGANNQQLIGNLTGAFGQFQGSQLPTTPSTQEGGFTLPAFNPADTSIGSLFG